MRSPLISWRRLESLLTSKPLCVPFVLANVRIQIEFLLCSEPTLPAFGGPKIETFKPERMISPRRLSSKCRLIRFTRPCTRFRAVERRRPVERVCTHGKGKVVNMHVARGCVFWSVQRDQDQVQRGYASNEPSSKTSSPMLSSSPKSMSASETAMAWMISDRRDS